MGDFPSGGELTIAQVTPSAAYASYQVSCSRVDNQAPIAVEQRGDCRAAVQLTLPAGAHVVCDRFNLAAAALVPTGGPSHEVPDGGLGLSRAEWEQIHGQGTASGATFTYEYGAYDVAFTDGAVTFIEIG